MQKEQEPEVVAELSALDLDAIALQSRKNAGWIGVDLDGTLAYYDPEFYGIGEPVELMKARVLEWVKNGLRVKIFTARAFDPEQIPDVQEWLKINGFPDLEVTNIKDFGMMKLFDDRAVEVEMNTGKVFAMRSLTDDQLIDVYNSKVGSGDTPRDGTLAAIRACIGASMAYV